LVVPRAVQKPVAQAGRRGEFVRLGRVNKSVILLTLFSAVRHQRKWLSGIALLARKRRETPLSGGAGTKNETSFVFWREKKPVGIGVSRFWSVKKGGLNLRRKATT
jgi:hypothetical protein